MRVSFLTLGCPKNEVDTDRMRATLSTSAHAVVDDLEEADLVVLNTCAFIADAVSESIDAVLELAEWKEAVPDRLLVAAGCMPSRSADMADMVPSETRTARAQELRDRANSAGVHRVASRVGEVLHVLVEEVDEDPAPEGGTHSVGRWRGQAPEIDGVVSLDQVVPTGSLVPARIVDSLGYDLLGEVTG